MTKESGRVMSIEESLSILKRANSYLEKCEWAVPCECGSCFKCAVQAMVRLKKEYDDLSSPWGKFRYIPSSQWHDVISAMKHFRDCDVIIGVSGNEFIPCQTCEDFKRKMVFYE